MLAHDGLQPQLMAVLLRVEQVEGLDVGALWVTYVEFGLHDKEIEFQLVFVTN
jgi:hypothetical protein